MPREVVAGLVPHHSEGSVALCCVNGLCKAFTATALRHPGEKSMHGLISFMRIMGPVCPALGCSTKQRLCILFGWAGTGDSSPGSWAWDGAAPGAGQGTAAPGAGQGMELPRELGMGWSWHRAALGCGARGTATSNLGQAQHKLLWCSVVFQRESRNDPWGPCSPPASQRLGVNPELLPHFSALASPGSCSG